MNPRVKRGNRVEALRLGMQRATSDLHLHRETLTISGLVAMQAEVEALGHGLMTDEKTLQMMVELANVPERRPIRCRFGHPGISENATGKQIGWSSNYRISRDARGTFLVCDMKLLESAKQSPAFTQDPIEYIFAMAEGSPEEFATSAVLKHYPVWVLADGTDLPLYTADEDGNLRHQERPADARYKLPVIRPVAFVYLDFVNEGAVTHDGMFSVLEGGFDDYSSAYLKELFDVVDRWRTAYGITLEELPSKVDFILSEYRKSRKGISMNELDAGVIEEPETEEAVLANEDLLSAAELAVAQLDTEGEEPERTIADRMDEQDQRIERLSVLVTKLTSAVIGLRKELAHDAGAPTQLAVDMTGGELGGMTMMTPVPAVVPKAPKEGAGDSPLARSVAAQQRRQQRQR